MKVEARALLLAPPEDVWEVFWYRGSDRPQHTLGRIEILHPGDEVGEGKIRTCWFRVPSGCCRAASAGRGSG